MGGAVGKVVTVDKDLRRRGAVGIKERPTTSAPCVRLTVRAYFVR